MLMLNRMQSYCFFFEPPKKKVDLFAVSFSFQLLVSRPVVKLEQKSNAKKHGKYC